jgi:DNA-3-methyladenine glycosylase
MTRRADPIAPAFFAVDAATLARRLLGVVLVRSIRGRRIAGVIVETEAYLGVRDRASHAYAGRRTPRNQSMYARPGTAYVYFTYGMHHCFNVVCGAEGVPAAVLVRALEPLDGLDLMHAARGPARDGSPRPPTDLCSGPGKLCRALGIDRRLDGLDLLAERELWLEPALRPPGGVRQSARVGVGGAGEWAARPLRWFIARNPHVSKGRPTTPAPERSDLGTGSVRVIARAAAANPLKFGRKPAARR